jgi:hypothetical protein
MALTQEDLAALGSFISSEVGKAVEAVKADFTTQASANREATVGHPDVPFDAGPEYYIHLADGTVSVSHDTASTHMPGEDGTPVAVIGRYLKGA